jgi:hypothetical protein
LKLQAVTSLKKKKKKKKPSKWERAKLDLELICSKYFLIFIR